MKEIESYYPKAFLARQGTNLPELSERLNKVKADFEKTLNELGDDVFYKEVSPGKWSPAEIADHVVKANELFIRALETLASDASMVKMPRGKVSDEGLPLSPQEEEPASDRDRADLARDLDATIIELVALGEASEAAGKLAQTCLDQSFFGPMTGLEVLQLAAWHIRHHEKQLPV